MAVAIMTVLTFSVSAFAGTYGGGTGIETDPYLIYTAEQMQEIGANPGDWNKHFKLVANIDLSGYKGTEFNIIGTDSNPFSGTFDGNGYEISNFTYTGGLFGMVAGVNAEIRDLGLINPNINSGGNNVGVLVNLLNDSTLSGCYVEGGGISGRQMVGGMVGQINGATIDNCYTTCTVSGIGTESSTVGGLVGLVGISGGTISDCYSTGTVSCTGVTTLGSVGGLVGENTGTIFNCYSTGSVSSNAHDPYGYVGGLVGNNLAENDSQFGVITNCYSSGDVTSDYMTGGLVGLNGGDINNSYAMGIVTGDTRVGGLVGYNVEPFSGGSGSISKCYSTGIVSGNLSVGGLVGYIYSGTLTACFWDTQTCLPATVGVGYGTSTGVTGKTTAEMKTESTFTGWDFDNIWYMADYPILQWELSPSPLQSRIDAAANGDVVVVQPGVYEGDLYFKGKNITLTSIDLSDPNIVEATILQGTGKGPVITFDGTEDESCVLSGFTITGGYNTSGPGGGIRGNDSAATIQNCLFRDNTATLPGGGIWGIAGTISNCIFENNHGTAGGGLAKCSGLISNCLIINNIADTYGTALHNCDGLIQNCTLVDNSQASQSLIYCSDGLLENCIMQTASGTVFSVSTAQTRYCCYPGAAGEGDIDIDPLFVDPVNGDYHLLPDSPCTDAGYPDSPWENEPAPNGARVNMGAYGNTSEATRSRAGLQFVGFNVINRTRIGLTTFRYVLSLSLNNITLSDMTDVTVKLIDADEQVIDVADDEVFFSIIASESTSDSDIYGDYFTIDVDRSAPITAGRLTWQIDYTALEGSSMQMMSLGLPAALGEDGVLGDITGEGDINIADLIRLAEQWLWTGTPGSIDEDIAPPPDGDGKVNLLDFAVLAENWMK